MTTKTITVDARMLRSAGIGTVLSNLLPGLLRRRPEWRFQLLGWAEELEGEAWARDGRTEIIDFRAPIHSMREQREWPYAPTRASSLLISPNYNIPLRWHGRMLTIVHDMAHLALPQIYGSLLKRLYAQAMFRMVRRKSSVLVFDSKFTETEFCRLIGKPRKSQVIYPGVARSWFGAKRAEGVGPRYAVFVGNVKPHKNLHRLLQAFAEIRNQVPHRLVIVGRRDGFITPDTTLGPLEEQLGDRLLFSGTLPLDQLQTLVAGADALVYPSLYEGFGLPPLEAMAAGCPSLVANIASIPEICGGAAHYCNPLDVGDMRRRLLETLSDGEFRQRLKVAGRTRAEMFNWDTCAEQYVEVADRILAGAVH